GDIEAALGIDGNGMRDGKLARLAAKLAPFLDELAGLVEVNDAGIAVAVGDEDVASRGDGHVSGLVQMRLIAAELPRRADRQEQLAFRRVFLDDVVFDVGDPDVAFVVDLDVMRRLTFDLVLAPGTDEFTV